ncbi:T9SS type A sorting domain-containing protein [Rasiella sp. SM2506]|uniref:T9SS type A sorting domain-containing protein n=1 Tax=Rasiella sp. SM2506 TaxID=3423914 RepID=UPI003D796236
MKKILLLCGLFYSMVALAQDPQLFDTTWYLENIIIDGTQINAPSNDEVPFVEFIITNDGFNTYVCNFAIGEVAFSQTEDTFEILNMVISLIDCDNQVNTVFEGDYFQDFFGPNFIFDNPFAYEITTSTGDSKQLVLTSASGNTATYNNAILSVNEQHLGDFISYPNPVASTVTITPQSNTLVAEVTIFNITGQQILQKQLELGTNDVTLDLTSLQSGLYFAQIKDHNGRSHLQRMVKK